MLINFYVKNFRSIRDEINLSMVSDGRYKNHLDHREPVLGMDKHALKLAVLYGANAAGKSNIVRAIGFAQDMVLEGETAFGDWRAINLPGELTNRQSFSFSFKPEAINSISDLNLRSKR